MPLRKSKPANGRISAASGRLRPGSRTDAIDVKHQVDFLFIGKRGAKTLCDKRSHAIDAHSHIGMLLTERPIERAVIRVEGLSCLYAFQQVADGELDLLTVSPLRGQGRPHSD